MSEDTLPRRLRMQRRKEGTGRTASYRVFDFSGIRTGWTAQNVEKDEDGFDNIDQFFDLGTSSPHDNTERNATPPQKGSSSVSQPPMRTPAPPSPIPEAHVNATDANPAFDTAIGFDDLGGGGFDDPEPAYSGTYHTDATAMEARTEVTGSSTITTTIQKRPRGRPRKHPVVEPLDQDYASLSLLTGARGATGTRKRSRKTEADLLVMEANEYMRTDRRRASYYDDVEVDGDEFSEEDDYDTIGQGRRGTGRLVRPGRRTKRAAIADDYYSGEGELSDLDMDDHKPIRRSRSAVRKKSPPRKRGRPKGSKTTKRKTARSTSSRRRYADYSSDSGDEIEDERGVVYIDGKRHRQERPSIGSGAKTIIEPIDDGTNSNTRYSRRRRWEPLHYWEGERIRYHAEKGAVVAVKEGVASPELVRRNQHFGAGLRTTNRPSKSRARSRSTVRRNVSDSDSDGDASYPKPRARRSASARRTKKNLSAELEEEDKDINREALEEAIYIASKGTIRQKKADIPEGITETPSNNLQVLLEDGVTSYQIAVVRRADALTYEKLPQEFPRPPNLPHVSVAAAAFDAPEFISGTVRLLPRSMKDMESTHDCTQVFVVMNAQPRSLQVDIGPNVYFLSPGDHFFVPKHCNYALTNHSEDTAAEVYFNVLKGSAVEEPLAPHIMQDISDPPISSLFSDNAPIQSAEPGAVTEGETVVMEKHVAVGELQSAVALPDSAVVSESEADSLDSAPIDADEGMPASESSHTDTLGV